jgi:hypothetical protein
MKEMILKVVNDGMPYEQAAARSPMHTREIPLMLRNTLPVSSVQSRPSSRMRYSTSMKLASEY